MKLKYASLALSLLALSFTACKYDDDDDTVVVTPALRSKMDANSLTATSPYTGSFKDASAQSTVDLTTSNQQLDMFTELDSYIKTVTSTTTTPAPLDGSKLQGMYTNTGSYFAGTGLNSSGLSLRNSTAASFNSAQTQTVRTYLDTKLSDLATASQNLTLTATPGNAGMLTTAAGKKYLVDAKGFELGQVIQKSLIGSVLLDQVSNLLLNETAQNADNSKVVDGKPYSALEHNWDMAYGFMTANPVMTTDYAILPREKFLTNYMNEMNGTASPAVYMAFLKGRAAVVNNDRNEAKAQANFIRTELEKTIALAAISYLQEWKAESDLALKAHALGEGVGFIYSLRFCTKYGVDTAWADSVLEGIIAKPQGAWDLTNADADSAINAIKAKFNI